MGELMLSLRIDEGRGPRPQGRVEGQVVAVADQPLACERLEVGLALEVRSVHGASLDEAPALELFSGPLPAGETVHPFVLTAPFGHFEHQGEHFSFSWVVRARAEVAGGREVTSQTDIPMKPPPEVDREISAPPPPDEPQPKEDDGWWTYGFCGVLFLVGLGLLGYGLYADATDQLWQGVAASVFAVLVALFAWWGGKKSAGTQRIERLVGRPRLAVRQCRRDGYRAGEPGSLLETTVTVKKSALELVVTATLMVEERVAVVHGANHLRTERFSKLLHTDRVTLSRVEPGVYQGLLPVPRSGTIPSTLPGGQQGIVWEVEAEVTEEGKRWFRTQSAVLDAKSVPVS